MSSVSVRDLTLAFGGLNVLDNLSIEVPDQEFLVLLGPSGCGKSTLLNCIAGLIEASSGEVRIGDQDVTDLEPGDRNVGMVFQSYALYPRMTVRENLSFGLKMARVPKADIEKRVTSAANILQISHLMDRRPAELSGGQRQRVAIGRALVRDVNVYLFDEPLSNLDAKLRTELRVELKRLHQQLGSTMIYVTHDQIEAMTLADRIAIMKGGVIQQLGTPAEIYSRPKNTFVAAFVGSPSMNFIPGRINVRNGQAWAQLEAGGAVNLSGYVPQTVDGLRDGADVIVGIRPEQFTPGDASTDTSISLVVSLTETLGADNLIWSSFGDKPISIRVAGTDHTKVGDTIHANFKPAELSIFDAGSGDRL